MPQYTYGLGQLVLVPLPNSAGVRTTPVMVGTLQDVSLNIDYAETELYGIQLLD